MLRLLRIRNLAVIEAAEVEFEPGFNVLTGETGAGKSILVEAVGLLLGGRASADLVRTGEEVATIEALFDEPVSGSELVVRREISNQGRSRAFINGALTTATGLRELAQELVELHGQHEHQALLDPATHLPLLDVHAGLGPLASQVFDAWGTMRNVRDQLDRSRMDAREKAARLDLIAFQLGEIDKVGPKPREDEELVAARTILASAERIQRLCEEGYAQLYESDQAILSGLSGVWKRVGELSTIDERFAPFLDARDSIKSQLEDLAFFMRRYADGVDASPARLQEIEDRLVSLERLKRKYGPSLQDALDRRESLARERDLLSGAGERATDLERALAAATDAYLTRARELSAARRAAARVFASRMVSMLEQLAMKAQFEVRFNAGELAPDRWSERGIDDGEFFLSANPGEDPRPLARIVSGGELSRVMLAVKTIAAGDPERPRDGRPSRTLIFDEVDAGIGGRVADVVGQQLQHLGRQFQVLCITHLPQIAARAAIHFRISKSVRANRTVTRVDRLAEDGRVEELARMIGGDTVGTHVMASARELLNERSGRQPSASNRPASPQAKVKNKAKGESESRPRG